VSLSDLLPDESYPFDLEIWTDGMGDLAVSSMEVAPEVVVGRGSSRPRAVAVPGTIRS